MTVAAYIPLIGFICNFLLAVFVLSRGIRSTPNRVYFAVLMVIAMWNLGSCQLFRISENDLDDALFWARFLHFGLIFGPVLLFHLSLIIAQIPVGKYIRWMYAVEALISLTDFTPYFIKTAEYGQFTGWYARGGPAYDLFSGQFVVFSLSIIILVRKRKALPLPHQSRLTALILAQSLLIAFGANDILPIKGITHYPFTGVLVYPWGSFAAIFYGVMVAYSMLQYQLLDLHLVLSRFVAHAIRFGFMFIIGLSLLLLAARFQHQNSTQISLFAALGVILVTGIIATVFFPRLFGAGTEALERRMLGDRFEYHDKMRDFIASMQFFTDTNLLLEDFQDLLLKTILVRSYKIILLDETTRAFSLFRSFPEEASPAFPDFQSNSPIFRFFQDTKAEHLAFRTGYAAGDAASLEDQARDQLKHFEAEFCFPFVFEEEPFGLLLLGEKKNGNHYTATDLNLFVSLVKNLSMMINQIRLKNQILQTQELELLGRMSRGMAHDLNNLLTPIWTLLQLVDEGASTQDLREDLLPVALRNIKTMREYVHASLFYSENLRPDFQLGRLDVVIAHAVEITQTRAEAKSISLLVDAPSDVLVEMDEALIQRLIANLISNAIDASPLSSTIRIELVRLVKTELTRDWLRVRVIDQGEGIKPDDLNRVLTPYFTTKDRGDKERGFGLGLSICRKIVHLHGGNLNIASQLKKGTTVQIDLPSRQTKLPIPQPA